ncbi:MAG TPA: hypothetical protein VFQ00_05405 [Terriglobales bacterium]|nr:hypothetical protein [Terriglobales bacterium]
MSIIGWCIVFAVPAIAVAFAWRKAAADWVNARSSIAGLLCLALASGSIALALGLLAWAEFIKPPFYIGALIELFGTLLSLIAVIAGFCVRRPSQRRYFGLGLIAAVWMFALYGLSLSSA